MNKVKLIAGAVLALVVCVVCLQNTEAVDTRLLFVTISMPRIVLLAVTFLVGLVVGGLVTSQLLGKRRERSGTAA